MAVYFSTFISGLQNYIEEILPKNFKKVKVLKLMDGAILYETDESSEDIRFFNNTFLVINTFDIDDIDIIIKSSNPNVKEVVDYIKSQDGRSFHIFTSRENQLISVDKRILSQLENKISKLTKLKLNIEKKPSDFEFWILTRSEGISLFMLRISKNKKKLEKGELRLELVNVMCQLSNMTEEDVCLDPFCGSGAILLERSRIANFKGLFNCDTNEENYLRLKNYIKKLDNKKLNKSFFVKNINFFDNNFDDKFFDKIITDPPWGYYEQIDNIQLFYNNMLKEFSRILKSNGIAVVLTANKEELEKAAKEFGFAIKNRFDILVSGKKACIYSLVLR